MKLKFQREVMGKINKDMNYNTICSQHT